MLRYELNSDLFSSPDLIYRTRSETGYCHTGTKKHSQTCYRQTKFPPHPSFPVKQKKYPYYKMFICI